MNTIWRDIALSQNDSQSLVLPMDVKYVPVWVLVCDLQRYVGTNWLNCLPQTSAHCDATVVWPMEISSSKRQIITTMACLRTLPRTYLWVFRGAGLKEWHERPCGRCHIKRRCNPMASICGETRYSFMAPNQEDFQSLLSVGPTWVMRPPPDYGGPRCTVSTLRGSRQPTRHLGTVRPVIRQGLPVQSPLP